MPLPGACMRPMMTLDAKSQPFVSDGDDGDEDSQLFRGRGGLEVLRSSCVPLGSAVYSDLRWGYRPRALKRGG